MRRARIGRALLALIGHRADEARELSAQDWQTLDAMAEQHRLQPFLHHRSQREELPQAPETVRAAWRQAYEANGIAVLAQRRALLRAVGVLSEHGIGAVALKGSALAWMVWPEPASREMRDIDLLVAADDAPRAYGALLAADWEGPALSEQDAQRFALEQTHFPALVSPEGVQCELHAHVWLRPAVPNMAMPDPCDERFLGNARYEEQLGAAVPGTQDMLAHLVVHAASSHLLNVGPGALIDIDLWCARKLVDWRAFWERAQCTGYARPAALVFALVDRWRREGFLEEARCPVRVSDALLDRSELLMVQDLDQRKDAYALSSFRLGSARGKVAQDALDKAAKPVSKVQRMGQLMQRSASLTRSLLRRDTRQTARSTAALRDWLSG